MNDKVDATKVIKRKHPEYDSLSDHWEFLYATYYGGRKWFKDNIFRYHKEGNDEFNQRLERAYRFNHSREIVDLVNKYLFRPTIERPEENVNSDLTKFLEDTRGSGKASFSIDDFMKLASRLSSMVGRSYVVIDRSGEVSGRSKSDANHVKTYAYIVLPTDVLDMAFDDSGDLVWILIREFTRDDDNPFEGSGEVSERYRLWTKEKWYLIEKPSKKSKSAKYHVTDEGDHKLGRVPVVIIDNAETDSKYSCPALIGDIAYLDRAIANYLSNLDAIIQDQTFSQLAIPAQALTPGSDAERHMVEMGTKRVFTFDGEGGTPFFLSPDPKQAQLIITVIQQVINEIYHSVGVAGERTKQDNSAGIDNSSGVAKAYDFDRVNSLLSSKAKILERAENEICEIVCLWSESDIGDYKVSYPREFDVKSLSDEIEIANDLLLISAPMEVRKEQFKSVIKKLFKASGKDKQERLMKSLETWEDSLDLSKSLLSNSRPEAESDPKSEDLESNNK